MLDQNALNGDTGLAGIAEGAGDAAFGGVKEVGITVYDGSGVATEFQDDFLFSGSAFDVPADGDTAGETDEFDAVVSDEEAGVVVGEWEDIEAAIGPTGLLDAFRQKQRTEGSLGGGLEDHGAAGSDGGGYFVRNQIQGEIEGGDTGNGSKWKALDHTPAVGGGLLPVERKIFAVDTGGFFGGNIEDEDGAIDFDTSHL